MKHRILTICTVVAALAVVGAGGATAASLITGKQVKNRSLTGKDVKKASLGPAVLTGAAKATLQGAPGAAGKDGADGAPGATGPAGATGPSDVFTHRRAEASVSQNVVVATQTLPAGLYAVSASFVLGQTNGGKQQTCSLLTGKDTVLASESIAMGSADRVSLTVAGAGQVTDNVRLSCALDDKVGMVTNISIVSTKTSNAPVTTES